jgi:hypothetical protein
MSGNKRRAAVSAGLPGLSGVPRPGYGSPSTRGLGISRVVKKAVLFLPMLTVTALVMGLTVAMTREEKKAPARTRKTD